MKTVEQIAAQITTTFTTIGSRVRIEIEYPGEVTKIAFMSERHAEGFARAVCGDMVTRIANQLDET